MPTMCLELMRSCSRGYEETHEILQCPASQKEAGEGYPKESKGIGSDLRGTVRLNVPVGTAGTITSGHRQHKVMLTL